jgi:glucose-1-phosphate cytidylyltransferase
MGRAADRADPGRGGAALKVVIFCGGLGLRMREESTRLPKPMIPLGDRPILWHIMKYYSDFGVREFILCLGYKAEVIKDYFLNYNEALSNDFVLTDGGHQIELLGSDTHDWSMTFVNTGVHSTIGERLKKVERYIGADDVFLATYGDGLTDAPLHDMVATLKASEKTALFLCVHPTYQFHVVSLGEGNDVREISDVAEANLWINGGYFAFRREIFDYLEPGEDLVGEAFGRLVGENKLAAYPYEGFWAPMDTLKDKQTLESLLELGDPPWANAHDRAAAETPLTD